MMRSLIRRNVSINTTMQRETSIRVYVRTDTNIIFVRIPLAVYRRDQLLSYAFVSRRYLREDAALGLMQVMHQQSYRSRYQKPTRLACHSQCTMLG